MKTEERLAKHLSKEPQIAASAYVAAEATVLGDVRIGDQASVWPSCVLRGDINSISIGDRTNVQDGTCLLYTSPSPRDGLLSRMPSSA